jgi:hypothetical protein
MNFAAYDKEGTLCVTLPFFYINGDFWFSLWTSLYVDRTSWHVHFVLPLFIYSRFTKPIDF